MLRLSLVYALLDGTEIVSVPHLQSARALWEYSERSADYIFGDATGDSVADSVLSSLRQRGRMSRTDLYNLFRRHLASARITLALDLLISKGLARTFTEDTGGRPLKIWEPVNSAHTS